MSRSIVIRHVESGKVLELSGRIEHQPAQYKDISRRGVPMAPVLTRAEHVRVSVSEVPDMARVMSELQPGDYVVELPNRQPIALKRATVRYQDKPESLRSVWVAGSP